MPATAALRWHSPNRKDWTLTEHSPETGIVIHATEYEQNSDLFKKFEKLAQSHGFEVEYTYVKRGVFVDLSWLF